MALPNHDRRKAPRRRTLKDAKIVFNGRRSVISSTLRNLSSGGALLVLPTIAGTPSDDFEVCIDGSYHSARAVWRSTTNLGVAWVADPNKKPQ
jgi:PilZ domain